MNNAEKINAWFDRFEHKMDNVVPGVIAETATAYYKQSFIEKGFDGKKWPETEKPVKKGSLMVRSSDLVNSVRPSVVNSSRVRISAGSSKVPYAKIQNEGGVINRAARSETFVRNRYKSGPKSKAFGGQGLFKKGTTAGQGYSFKAYSITIPARPFMRPSAILNKLIIQRLKSIF